MRKEKTKTKPELFHIATVYKFKRYDPEETFKAMGAEFVVEKGKITIKTENETVQVPLEAALKNRSKKLRAGAFLVSSRAGIDDTKVVIIETGEKTQWVSFYFKEGSGPPPRKTAQEGSNEKV